MESNFKKEDITQFLKKRVHHILQPLQKDILRTRPANISQFAYQWLSSSKKNIPINASDQDIDCNDNVNDELFNEMRRKKLGKQKFREGISGESTKISALIPIQGQKILKTVTNAEKLKENRIQVLVGLHRSVLFRDIKDHNIMQIIASMKEVQYQEGQIVIKEGQIGNQMFIVDHGLFKGDMTTQEKMYGPGQAFGELALLYGTKRASTITAFTDGKLLVLDRQIYNQILRENVIKRMKLFEKTINKVQGFEVLDAYQKSKLLDNLGQKELQSGQYIIRQGQIGDCFYVVAEGKLVAEKIDSQGSLKPVYYYKQGDYFGQVALVRNVNRQASVKALTRVRLVFLQRSQFKRLLGSFENMMIVNQSRYEQNQSQQDNS